MLALLLLTAWLRPCAAQSNELVMATTFSPSATVWIIDRWQKEPGSVMIRTLNRTSASLEQLLDTANAENVDLILTSSPMLLQHLQEHQKLAPFSGAPAVSQHLVPESIRSTSVAVAISGFGLLMNRSALMTRHLPHNALTCSAVPIPPWERSLQTVEAQPYFNVSQASLVLEGIVFDRNNNLLFVDVATGRVFKLTPERQLSIVLKENSFGASGLAVHKDGRIFIASVGDMQRGSVRAIEPNGTREQMIVAPDTGFLVNDLVFDNQGGFYFTDSRGNSADPQGGVFYVSPNVGSIHAILPGLAVGNGIAIDPGGSQIWATEHAKNRLHRVRLSDATTVAPFGSVVTYQFTGPAPDGARVDSEGNVYVAISGQGRVMVFNRNGLPIGQIVLPDRDKGRNLKSTSLAIRPGHRELFIVANSGTEPGGAMIFRSGAFAPAPFPFSHQ
ncbi:TPA: SMP-30/gluconolactonase/LRE family protein [Klebsiella pneumoniae]